LTGTGLRGLAEEQAALRRVATLVARGAAPEEVFAAVTEEVAQLMVAEMSNMARYEPDGGFTIVGSVGILRQRWPIGSRWPPGGNNTTSLVFETAGPARIQISDEGTGEHLERVREVGLRSAVAVPIIVEGRLWGVIGVATTRAKPLPADTEARLSSFTELVATAIANAESRAELARLAEPQAALRRVATLVAQGVPPEELFAAVAEEMVNVLPVRGARIGRYESDGTVTCVATTTEPGAAEALAAFRLIVAGKNLPLGGNNLATVVSETGRPARLELDDASGPIVAGISEFGGGSAVGTPIVVDGRLWGLATAGSTVDRPLPPDTEARLTDFTELVATAIANAESRAGLARLAEEQEALRRVATLVARGVSPEEVFASVTEEVERLFLAEAANLARFESDGTFTVVASARGHFPVGSRLPMGGKNIATMLFETGHPCRLENVIATGPLADPIREAGIDSAVGTPIIVEGHLWGGLSVGSTRESLPADTEARLTSFTELVATAIANAESRASLAQLAEEQESLRRVATLVARGVPPEEVFASVTEEVERLFLADMANLIRFESDRTFTILASALERFPVGSQWPIRGKNPTTTIFETGRPARVDDYADNATGPLVGIGREAGLRSTVAAPIIVEGRLWGAIGVGSNEATLPPDTEARLVAFTELVAMAIANTESRAGLARLVEEQAALGRVATLVAEGAPAAAVFDAVAAEMGTLLVADGITLVRYEPGDELTVLVHRGPGARQVPPGSRVRHDGDSVSATVRRTHRPARMASYADTRGHIGEVIGGLRFGSGVGAPIVVDGRLWGATIANWTAEEPPPPGTEDRLAKFARLLDTAIANADSRDQLTASRARLVTEAHEARRRVVRDLHDGGQRLLVHTIIKLKLARRALNEGRQDLAPLLSEALEHAETANDELRDLSHGMLPTVLTREGVRAGVDELAAATSIPVEIDVGAERLPAVVEATAYFVVAEALTNVVKHARAERAEVRAFVKDETLYVEVRDNGVGGANPRGHGLVGLSDRLTALGGRFSVESPAQGGTILAATLPLNSK
jgi:GAF domain-containing protein